MATAQAYNKRDFGQKKRAVTMAITGVEDAAAVYDSLKIQVITNKNDAEELFTKIKTLQKSSLPSLKSKFVNRIDDKSYQFHLTKKLSIYDSRTKQNSKRTRSITPLPIGIPILIYDQKKGGFFQDGVVVSRGNTPFSYVVEDSFGRRLNRNRRHASNHQLLPPLKLLSNFLLHFINLLVLSL